MASSGSHSTARPAVRVACASAASDRCLDYWQPARPIAARLTVPFLSDESRSWFFPLGDLHRTQIVPYVTYALIAINVVVFLVQQQQGDEFTLAYAATPYEIYAQRRPRPAGRADGARSGCATRSAVACAWKQRPLARPHVPCPIPIRWTLLTSMFLHGSWMHLIGNMLYLWIVGDNVEEVLGSFRYLIVYLACGLVGSLAQIAVDPDSVTPTLGASGAIAGIMGAYVIWFPHNQIRVLLFRFITVLPAVDRHRRLDRASDLAGGRLDRPRQGTRGRGLPRPRGRRHHRHRRRLPVLRSMPATSRNATPPRRDGRSMRDRNS